MTFRIPSESAAKPDSPEDVFPTLKNRSPLIKHLWSHQADLLRAYAEKDTATDIALELATGAGKSLVGLLIAEYRRQAHEERVAYLCPTRQLAYQLHARAKSYGITTVVLVGAQKDYPPADFTAYTRAQKIAVTTYSAVFNTNPRIDNAQCLLLDDAHAGENYIAKLWSVRVSRDERPTYDAIVNLFADALPEALVFRLTDDRPGFGEDGGAGVVVPPLLWSRSAKLREVLDAGAELSPYSYSYSWSILSPHLDACMLYVSWSEILIRPLFPPSQTHEPFWAAKQRVYMSATLGNGGDLERATGVAKITRLPPPPGWDKQGTGRRLILLPDLSLRPEETDALVASVLSKEGRALVLTTDGGRANAISAGWLAKTGKTILGAADIEEDLGAFTEKPNAALLLTNRYDGIDLPDDTCRMLVIDELPDATNLQERFFTQRLGADAFLRERIRTRITQALGRCTRNDSDFATVLVLGTRVASFLAQKDVVAALHPELQAELAFGLENSGDQTIAGFKAIVDGFQGKDWPPVEKYLAGKRKESVRKDDPVAAPLRTTVGDELAYVYAAWAGDWPQAHARARAVSDALGGGGELKPYRALWYALAGFTALRADLGAGQKKAVEDLLSRATVCGAGWIWFLRPARAAVEDAPTVVPEADALAIGAVARAAAQLEHLGTSGTRFDKAMNELRELLADRKAKPYERGLGTLGALLGFQVLPRDPQNKAEPDSVWTLDNAVVIGWEAKSEEDPAHPIPIRDVRDTNGHFAWIRDQLKMTSEDPITIVLAHPRSTLDPEARRFAERLRYAHVTEVESLAAEVVRALAAVRRAAGAAGGEILRAELLKVFEAAGLLPAQLQTRFRPLAEIPSP
jgi:hypothetical protein